MPEEILFERIELTLLFILRTLCTNMSVNPIKVYMPPDESLDDTDAEYLRTKSDYVYWGSSEYCDGAGGSWHHDRSLAISTTIVALCIFPFLCIMVLNSFEHSIGPAPPVGPSDLADVRQGAQVINGVRPDDAPSELTRRLWPTLFDDTAGANLHHEIFNRRGVLRVSMQVGGLTHVIRVIVWKVVCLAKLAVGYWDRDVLIATNVLPRSEALLPHDLTAPAERQPKGLQLHQEFISVSGRTVATLFCLLPGGAILTKLSEAVNVWPVFVTTDVIDKDAHAIWAKREGALCTIFPTLLKVPPSNETLIVMNSTRQRRVLGCMFEVVHTLLVVALCIVADGSSESRRVAAENVASALMIWIILSEAKALLMDSEEQQYFHRRIEWDRRHREVMLGGHSGTKLTIANQAVRFSHLRVNNAPLAHKVWPDGFPRQGGQDDGRLIITSLENVSENDVHNRFVFMQRLSENVSFAEMARRAQDAGAIGVVIANSPAADEHAVPRMPSDDGAEVHIPVFGVPSLEWRRVVEMDLGFDDISLEEIVKDDMEQDEMAFGELLRATWRWCCCTTRNRNDLGYGAATPTHRNVDADDSGGNDFLEARQADVEMVTVDVLTPRAVGDAPNQETSLTPHMAGGTYLGADDAADVVLEANAPNVALRFRPRDDEAAPPLRSRLPLPDDHITAPPQYHRHRNRPQWSSSEPSPTGNSTAIFPPPTAPPPHEAPPSSVVATEPDPFASYRAAAGLSVGAPPGAALDPLGRRSHQVAPVAIPSTAHQGDGDDGHFRRLPAHTLPVDEAASLISPPMLPLTHQPQQHNNTNPFLVPPEAPPPPRATNPFGDEGSA